MGKHNGPVILRTNDVPFLVFIGDSCPRTERIPVVGAAGLAKVQVVIVARVPVGGRRVATALLAADDGAVARQIQPG